MSKWERILRSFYKNIILKRKFKSYYQSFVDKEYRAQINELYELTKHSTGTVMKYVPTSLLTPGHKIIYPEYAQSLIDNEEAQLEPIKVVACSSGYVVVDGNHRLPAILARAKKHGTNLTYCKVII
jgi:hypothetical protein